MRGVDVSGWQSVDGADYAAAGDHGDTFVICKLSQGERRSKKGMRHAAKALDADVNTGAYHFADPLKLGLRRFRPTQQADVFCDAVEASGMLSAPWPYSMPRLWLDMEWKSFGKTTEGKARGKRFRRQFKPSEVMRWTRAFIAHVQNRLGVRCGIYTGRSYVRYRFDRNPELVVYDLWLASYVGVGDDRAGVPAAGKWPRTVRLVDDLGAEVEWLVVLWQWTGRGSVLWYRGGKGKIDRNMTRPRAEVC